VRKLRTLWSLPRSVIATIATSFPQLAELALPASMHRDMQHATLPALEALRLTQLSVQVHMLEAFSECTSLVALTLPFWSSDNDPALLQGVSRFSNLTSLTIGSAPALPRGSTAADEQGGDEQHEQLDAEDVLFGPSMPVAHGETQREFAYGEPMLAAAAALPKLARLRVDPKLLIMPAAEPSMDAVPPLAALTHLDLDCHPYLMEPMEDFLEPGASEEAAPLAQVRPALLA
jgi:hypothetical protein